MSSGEYQETLAGFAHLRARASTLEAFGFRRNERSGWLYAEPIVGASLECRVFISTKGDISEKVIDLGTGDE